MKVPEGWKTVTLKETAARVTNSFIDGDWIEAEHITSEGIRFIQTGNIGMGTFIDKPDTRKFITSKSFKELKCKSVYPGDLLICRLADPIGRTCLVPDLESVYVTSVDVVIFRVNSVNYNKLFLLYCLNRGETLKKIAELAGGSTRQRVSRTNLERIEIYIPKEEIEQSKIAEILSIIDDAIDKTESLIQKYQRIKQGLMQDLLTKGIDEHGNIRDEKTHKFKDSPLGRIPEEWEVFPLGKLCRVQGGYAFKSQDFKQDGIRIIKISNLQNEKVDSLDDDVFVSGDRVNIYKSYLICNNDMLIALSGATTGKIGRIKKDLLPVLLNQRVGRFKVFTDKADQNFIYYLVTQHYFFSQIINNAPSSAQPNVSPGFIESIPIKCPKLDEQQRIVFILDSLDVKIEKEQTYKQKLLSSKLGLMEDLLTGAIRVNHLIGKN